MILPENIQTLIYHRVEYVLIFCFISAEMTNQRTNGPVNAHLISWPSKAQNIQNLENIL